MPRACRDICHVTAGRPRRNNKVFPHSKPKLVLYYVEQNFCFDWNKSCDWLKQITWSFSANRMVCLLHYKVQVLVYYVETPYESEKNIPDMQQNLTNLQKKNRCYLNKWNRLEELITNWSTIYGDRILMQCLVSYCIVLT